MEHNFSENVNKFLGKKLLSDKYLKITDNLSIHYTLNLIRSFHKTPDFLLTFILQNFFNSVNKKKLKNSFIEKFHSNLLWVEINKMINVKLLSFSKTYLCRGNKSFSILSEYLFDIYLQDLNLFINSLYTKYNNQVFLLSNMFQPLPIYFSPVKFGRNKDF